MLRASGPAVDPVSGRKIFDRTRRNPGLLSKRANVECLTRPVSMNINVASSSSVCREDLKNASVRP